MWCGHSSTWVKLFPLDSCFSFPKGELNKWICFCRKKICIYYFSPQEHAKHWSPRTEDHKCNVRHLLHILPSAFLRIPRVQAEAVISTLPVHWGLQICLLRWKMGLVLSSFTYICKWMMRLRGCSPTPTLNVTAALGDRSPSLLSSGMGWKGELLEHVTPQIWV